MKPENISIIIPTHNRVCKLERLLQSIDKQKIPPLEVIIINDGSKDNTKEFLNNWQQEKRRFFPIVYNNPISGGPATARNIGIQLASAEAIAFTDDDCILQSSWIRTILESKVWEVEDIIVGIGGRVLPYSRGIVSEYYSFHHILEPPPYIQYLVTANACYLKKTLIEVSGFDETYGHPGGEDNDLSFKLSSKGYKFGFEKKMIIWHDYRTSISSFIKTFYRYGKGCGVVSQKVLNIKPKTKMDGY